MIVVTRLNNTRFAVNPDLIERIQSSPDTTLTLVGGTSYIVTESMDEVIEMIAAFRAGVIARARAMPTFDGPGTSLGVVQFDRAERTAPLREPLMDPATIIGIVLAFGALLAMMTMEGASLNAILLPAPMILVFGATIAVGIASTTVPDAIQAVKSLPRAFKGVKFKPQATIDQLVELAEVARRQGLLALEQEADKIDDDFLKSALQGVADGMDAEDLAIMLEDQVATRERSARQAAKFFTSMGGYAPTIGIIGTVVSLTHVLENLSDPGSLGHSIAAAFVATLWGVLSANFLWLPIGTRLIRLVELDVQRMTIIVEGILALQAGNQPRVVGERLRALVPAHALAKSSEKSAKPEKAAKAA